MSPVFGSTREILPAAPSVTYSAPPGPTVLPEPPSRPVTSWVGFDVRFGLAVAVAVAVGATMAIATVASAISCLVVMVFSLLSWRLGSSTWTAD